MPKDYYAILGVSKTASDDEVKKAFRRLAHEHHPDKGGDAQKFKDVNEAYQVLSDKKKRATYDQFGSAAFEQGGGPGPGGFGQGFGGPGGFGFDFSQGFGDVGDLGDVLGEMFGFGGGTRSRKPRGQDIEVDAELSFHDAAFGVEKTLRIYKGVACGACQGHGAETGSKLEKCKACDGQGQVKRHQRTMFGVVQTAAVCEECHGRGQKPEKDCRVCHGTGVERKETSITFTIPPGMESGEGIKISGQGEAAPFGGHPGDLIVRVRVKADPRFEREDHDVVSDVHVPFSTMVLGGSVEVDTLDGKETISVDAGTPAGTVIQLRQRGIAYARGGRGAHRLTLIPIIPKKLSREQKDLLQKLKEEGI